MVANVRNGAPDGGGCAPTGVVVDAPEAYRPTIVFDVAAFAAS